MVAVLCAAPNSVYNSIPGVDVYDRSRDCRSFTGDAPVVAHPPCRSWSAFCRHQAKPEPGEKELGPWCVERVRENGGVLEHPAYSLLWNHCKLPLPGQGMRQGLWSACVSQAWWGDVRSKNTWLLFSRISIAEVEIPFRLHSPKGDRRRWQVMSKHQRAATPPAMAKWFVETAMKVA